MAEELGMAVNEKELEEAAQEQSKLASLRRIRQILSS